MLFKDGKAAMIINGEWSWAGYMKAGVDIGVAPLPQIASTGLYCAPMISPKGYCLNSNVDAEKRPRVLRLLRFLMEPEVQLQTARAVYTMPTRREALASEFVRTNDILRNSVLQIERGRAMPVMPELRAVWDAMRPSYQAVLGAERPGWRRSSAGSVPAPHVKPRLPCGSGPSRIDSAKRIGYVWVTKRYQSSTACPSLV